MAKIITITKNDKTVAGIEYTSPSGVVKQVQLPATFTHNGVKHTTTTPTQAHADAYEAKLIEDTIKAQTAYASRTPEQIAKDEAAIEANRQKQLEIRANMTPEELEAERIRGLEAAQANELTL